MRTTLTIDDDVLAAAKALSEQERRTIGEVLSDLARKALRDRLIRLTRRCGWKGRAVWRRLARTRMERMSTDTQVPQRAGGAFPHIHPRRYL